MKKPTLETYTENLAWTLEFLHKQGRRNSIISGETPQKNTWIKKVFSPFPPKISLVSLWNLVRELPHLFRRPCTHRYSKSNLGFLRLGNQLLCANCYLRIICSTRNLCYFYVPYSWCGRGGSNCKTKSNTPYINGFKSFLNEITLWLLTQQ